MGWGDAGANWNSLEGFYVKPYLQELADAFLERISGTQHYWFPNGTGNPGASPEPISCWTMARTIDLFIDSVIFDGSTSMAPGPPVNWHEDLDFDETPVDSEASWNGIEIPLISADNIFNYIDFSQRIYANGHVGYDNDAGKEASMLYETDINWIFLADWALQAKQMLDQIRVFRKYVTSEAWRGVSRRPYSRQFDATRYPTEASAVAAAIAGIQAEAWIYKSNQLTPYSPGQQSTTSFVSYRPVGEQYGASALEDKVSIALNSVYNTADLQVYIATRDRIDPEDMSNGSWDDGGRGLDQGSTWYQVFDGEVEGSMWLDLDWAGVWPGYTFPGYWGISTGQEAWSLITPSFEYVS